MNQHSLRTTPTPAPEASAQHPPVEAWIAYYSDQIDDTKKSQMQSHLAQCRPCVDLVLDLDAFAEPNDENRDRASEFEKAAAWLAFKPTLTTSRWPTIAGLAASLIFATVGFSSWTQQRQTIGSLETRVSDLVQPRGNVVIQDLSPRSRQRSAGGANTTTELPASSAPITLILNLEEATVHPDYLVRILDGEGTEVRRISGLRPSEFDNFYIALPPDSLPVGAYELRLFGLASGQEDLLEIYPITLY